MMRHICDCDASLFGYCATIPSTGIGIRFDNSQDYRDRAFAHHVTISLFSVAHSSALFAKISSITILSSLYRASPSNKSDKPR